MNTTFIYVTGVMYSTVFKSQFKQVAQISFQHLLHRIYCLHGILLLCISVSKTRSMQHLHRYAFLNAVTRYILIHCSM